ncbi:MAG TPA: ATP-binding protein, partial [Longimicrobiales bacterium]
LPIERGNGILDDAWWTYSYSPVRDDDGSINGTLVVCLETTSSVKARAAVEFERKRLKNLFEHAPAFMCVLRGPDLVFEMTNENYQKLIGFREVIGMPIREALTETEPHYFDLLDQVLATGQPFVGRDMPVTVASTTGDEPERRYVSFVFQAIVEADGSRSGVFVHGVDVTQSMQMRKDLDAARVAAESANRAKSEFLAVMSHELRTPLNAIDGYAELLELGVHGPLTDAQRDDIDRIRRSERHLLGLINEVLNFTRIEAGVVTYDYEAVDLREAIGTCDALTVPQRRAKGLTFEFADCPAGAKVYVDADKLQQILLNLLSNAIKFTFPHGSIKVVCELRGEKVTVAVSDTGQGIPHEQLGRIFDPFVQVSTGHTRAQEGVGLGLSISRDLARAMGGDLTVTSTLGVGSTFTLTLRTAT